MGRGLSRSPVRSTGPAQGLQLHKAGPVPSPLRPAAAFLHGLPACRWHPRGQPPEAGGSQSLRGSAKTGCPSAAWFRKVHPKLGWVSSRSSAFHCCACTTRTRDSRCAGPADLCPAQAWQIKGLRHRIAGKASDFVAGWRKPTSWKNSHIQLQQSNNHLVNLAFRLMNTDLPFGIR